jgi:hypothetical protein
MSLETTEHLQDKRNRERPSDRELSIAFVRGLNHIWRSDFAAFEFPEDASKAKAVDVIATDGVGSRLAVEHTTIQPYLTERKDTVVFREVFVPLEEASFRLPGYVVELWPEVGGGILKKGELPKVGKAVASWFKTHADGLPNGDSIQEIPIPEVRFSFSVFVRKRPDSRADVLVGRSGLPDELQIVIQKAISDKTPKLVATPANKRILLLEIMVDIHGYERIVHQIGVVAPAIKAMEQVDEVWAANTVTWRSSGSLYFAKLWPDGLRDLFVMRMRENRGESAEFVSGRWHDVIFPAANEIAD